MSRDWTEDELQAVSAAMKAAGHMGYEEFCAELAQSEAQHLSEPAQAGERSNTMNIHST